MSNYRYQWPVPPEQTRILVVDDDTNIQLLARSILSQFDHFNVGVARDASSARAEFAHQRTQLVFLDIHLAGDTDGMALLAEFRQRHPAPFVVMLTADATLDNVRGALQAGAGFFIAKPFVGKKLHEALEKYYRRPCPPVG